MTKPSQLTSGLAVEDMALFQGVRKPGHYAIGYIRLRKLRKSGLIDDHFPMRRYEKAEGTLG